MVIFICELTVWAQNFYQNPTGTRT